MLRKLCPTCGERPVAVNYVSESGTHYRSQCDACLRKKKKIKPKPPSWQLAGYRKKPACEVCGFRAKLPDKQLLVYHLDGNLKNTDVLNLKTVCLNCSKEIEQKKNITWKPGDITADF